MNFNEEYIKLLEIVKKSMKETDNTKAETAIAKRLGRNTSFITDKKKSKKGYSEQDVFWLRYKFREILGFPIERQFIEVTGLDNSSRVNSDQQERSFSFALKSIAEAQRGLADQLKTLSAAAESISSDELDKVFQEILDSDKNSSEKKGKRGK